jgi:ABC-2 type transport system permease protein
VIHARIVLTVFLKDLIDAIRDARVLVAIIVPIGLGLFYNVTLSNNDPGRPDITVAYYAAEPSALPEALHGVIGPHGTLTIREQTDETEVRRVVANGGADVGLIVPAGFDRAIRGGERPSVKLIEPGGMGYDGQIFAQSLNPALRVLAGQEQPAVVETESPGSAFQDTLDVFNQVGFRQYSVLATMLFVIVMVSMLALPVILAEESEKRTLDALLLIASRSDVVIGKALVGLVYSSVGVGLLMGVTRLVPAAPAAFTAVLLLLTFTLIGFGLLLGTVFRSATQINNWSGFLLLPVFAPVFAVGFPVPDVVDLGLRLFPTSQSMRMALNALVGETLFEDQLLGIVVVFAWGVAAYALVFWQLRRQQR